MAFKYDRINPPPSTTVSYGVLGGTGPISKRLILQPPPARSATKNSTEIVVGPFADPLNNAIHKLGGPSVIRDSVELRCTPAKFPKDDVPELITGLAGRLGAKITIPADSNHLHEKRVFEAGSLWTIRWDYDPVTAKGPHVNFVCGDLKVAFRCMATLESVTPGARLLDPDTAMDPYPVNIIPGARYSSRRYFDAILDQSNSVDYDVVQKAGKHSGDQGNAEMLAELWEIRYRDPS